LLPRSRPFNSRTLALAALLSCSSPGASPPETAVIVGVQSEPLNGALGSLTVATTLGGAANTDAALDPRALPYEVKILPRGGDEDASVAVTVNGYGQVQPEADGGPAMPPLLLVRTAETHFVRGETKLLRVLLQGQCFQGLPGGPLGGPTCSSPQTCINGVCQSDVVPPQGLEPYTPAWASNTPDICKPANAGPPVVQVGTGQTDYLPVTDGQTVQMEQGPQGGHHVWIAVRQHDIAQTGSTTTITSVEPASGVVGPTLAFAFTFVQDEGGFCKLYGLRYQVDIDGADYHAFLGKPLDVSVAVADMSGTKGTGVAHLNIAPTLLCPSGVPGC
jgi:hypothetical protein